MSTTSFSFDSCGWMYVFHLGVAKYIQRHIDLGAMRDSARFCGASAGGVVASALAVDYEVDPILEEVCDAYEVCKTNPFHMVQSVEDGLNRLMPEDGHRRCTGRLFIAVTGLNGGHTLSDFPSRRFLISSLRASCHIPIVGGLLPAVVDSPTGGFIPWLFYDGGLSIPLPSLDEDYHLRRWLQKDARLTGATLEGTAKALQAAGLETADDLLLACDSKETTVDHALLKEEVGIRQVGVRAKILEALARTRSRRERADSDEARHSTIKSSIWGRENAHIVGSVLPPSHWGILPPPPHVLRRLFYMGYLAAGIYFTRCEVRARSGRRGSYGGDGDGDEAWQIVYREGVALTTPAGLPACSDSEGDEGDNNSGADADARLSYLMREAAKNDREILKHVAESHSAVEATARRYMRRTKTLVWVLFFVFLWRRALREVVKKRLMAVVMWFAQRYPEATMKFMTTWQRWRQLTNY